MAVEITDEEEMKGFDQGFHKAAVTQGEMEEQGCSVSYPRKTQY